MDLVRRRPAGCLYWTDIHKVSPYNQLEGEKFIFFTSLTRTVATPVHGMSLPELLFQIVVDKRLARAQVVLFPVLVDGARWPAVAAVRHAFDRLLPRCSIE